MGERVSVPEDARVWDMSGKTIYPGLIDAYSEVEVNLDEVKDGAPYWNEEVRPQLSMAQQYKSDDATAKKLRSQGITARLAVPKGGIFKGTSALITTGEDDNPILASDIAQHVRLTTTRGWGERKYPASPMGAVALARQAMHDARWYTDAWRIYNANQNLPRPDRNDALAALSDWDAAERLFIFDARNELYFLRADRFAKEFGLNIAIFGSGDEYRRLAAIAATGRTVIVPLNFPKAPNVATAEAAMNVSLERLMDWDLAPENPARLEAAGVSIALTAQGLDDVGKFRSAVRDAIDRGLDEDAALRAVTTTPAKLLSVDDRLGTLEVGRVANLVITDGPLFAKETKLYETWVSGQQFVLKSEPETDIRGEWSITLNKAATGGRAAPPKIEKLSLRITGEAAKPSGLLVAGKKEIKLDHFNFKQAALTAAFQGKELGTDGVAQLSAVYSLDGESPTLDGAITWPDGSRSPLSAVQVKTGEEVAEAKAEGDEEDKGEGQSEKDEESAEDKEASNAASFSVNYPLGAFGVAELPQQQSVLLQNATVWTSGEPGIIENCDVLFSDGKITAVGPELAVPKEAIVVDCTGKHITPGIIDCHSHMASDGGINEGTQTITAEVRIGDFVDPDDITIYRQLAGGVTSANILHGSANTIGGQNQVIKLRWGVLDEAMKFTEAPQGIKFALGENVKQSNWGEKYTTRYPQSRMGVEQIVIDAFEAAKAYKQSWDRWNTTRAGLPPRRDLELDALVEILAGKRWIHCHSYRQDEILALMRTLELYDVQIGSFQHILEGYKVAAEMARHGATGSSFADWWAYKIEVYDAIPYNGAIMHNAGVVVSFNSDDHEMGRHLNHEAAKAVKYGGVPREEALKFVTLNPAKQLRIDQYVGSIEVGKHADLVIWSGDPLSNFSRCEQTWIDGRKYFDIEDDRQRRQRVRTMRAKLIQKILASGAEMSKETDGDPKADTRFPRDDIYCGARLRKGLKTASGER